MRAQNLMIAFGAGWICSAFIGGPVGLLVGMAVTAGLTLTGLRVERQIRKDREEYRAFLKALDAKRTH